ncbi:MAG TPA: transposase [Lacunisphaera sp.]|nr:transposase [Lacunisphaera sp.]
MNPAMVANAADRQFSAMEKRRLLDETEKPGESVSTVARCYRLSPSMLFAWRKAMEAGPATGLRAEEPLVPESELKQLKAQMRELERMLGRKTHENEILKESVEVIRGKKLVSPELLPKTGVFGEGDRPSTRGCPLESA